MDRYTYRGEGEYPLAYISDKHYNHDDGRITGFAPERLAAYEDTGLTPDEIAALRAENDGYNADIEAGRLVRYPCRVGDTVWTLSRSEPELTIESERVDGIIDTGKGPIACRDYEFDGLGDRKSVV